jgi:hypothetical protein
MHGMTNKIKIYSGDSCFRIVNIRGDIFCNIGFFISIQLSRKDRNGFQHVRVLVKQLQID